MRLPLAAAASLGLVLAGCGPSPCSRIAGAVAGVKSKASACSNPGVSVEDVDRARCDKSIGRCTPDDLKKIDTYVVCLDAVPSCIPGHEAAFRDAVLACVAGLSAMSQACQTSI